jgi:hypothetical protein
MQAPMMAPPVPRTSPPDQNPTVTGLSQRRQGFAAGCRRCEWTALRRGVFVVVVDSWSGLCGWVKRVVVAKRFSLQGRSGHGGQKY